MLLNPPCLFFRDKETKTRVLTGFLVTDQLPGQVLNPCLLRTGSHLACFLGMATRPSTNGQETYTRHIHFNGCLVETEPFLECRLDPQAHTVGLDDP